MKVEIIDNIPIFFRYSSNSTKYLNELFRTIKEYNAVISLNQALLLKEYEKNLRATLHTLIEEMYNENLSYGLENKFFIDFEITPEDIKDCNIDESDSEEFIKYQNELKIIEKIKSVLGNSTGGCNCE